LLNIIDVNIYMRDWMTEILDRPPDQDNSTLTGSNSNQTLKGV